MSKLLAYVAGIISGLMIAGVLYVSLADREEIYVTSQDLSIEFDQIKDVACTVPSGTKITHKWSASEGFDQFCLSLNIEDRTSLSRTEQIGTSPYWLGDQRNEP